MGHEGKLTSVIAPANQLLAQPPATSGVGASELSSYKERQYLAHDVSMLSHGSPTMTPGSAGLSNSEGTTVDTTTRGECHSAADYVDLLGRETPHALRCNLCVPSLQEGPADPHNINARRVPTS